MEYKILLCKIVSLCVSCLLLSLNAYSQNPTLAVGLETLTMNKGTIDVEVLTEIIIQKQTELKQEAMKRFLLRLFPETNYATKFYIQHSLHILLNEKNPQVIKKELLELTTNYALVLGLAKAYSNKERVLQLNNYFKHNYRQLSSFVSQDLLFKKTEERKLRKLGGAYIKLSTRVSSSLDSVENSRLHRSKVVRLDSKRGRKQARYRRENLRNGNDLAKTDTLNKIPFGLLVDVVAASLSEIQELKDKGFYRKPINYKQDLFYTNLAVIGTEADRRFQKKLDSLQVYITDDLLPYIKEYEVLEAFFPLETDEMPIKDQLRRRYVQKIMALLGDGNNITPRLESTLGSIELKENVQTSLNKLVTLVELQKYVQAYQTRLRNIDSYHRMLDLPEEILPEDSVANEKPMDITRSTTKMLLDEEVKLFEQDFKSKPVADLELVSVVSKLNPITVTNSLTRKTLENMWMEVESAKTNLRDSLTLATKNMIENGRFLEIYLSSMILGLTKMREYKVPINSSATAAELNAYSSLLSEVYVRLNGMMNQPMITLKDISYIDLEVIPTLLKYSIIFDVDTARFSTIIQNFGLLSELLKLRVINKISLEKDYDQKLRPFLKFISKLDRLDNANSYVDMIKIFEEANATLEQSLTEGKFKEVYTLFSDAVKKYTIINSTEQHATIDVVSFLTELQQYFERNNTSRFGLYLSLGLSENYFLNTTYLPNSTEKIQTLGLASEKLGVKFRLKSFNRVKGYENTIRGDVNLNKRAPFLNQFYVVLYGSGLLYSIANTATNTNFDYPHVGGGIGLRFYNALDLNATIGLPFVNNQNLFKYPFIGLNLDIPLGEYLEKLGRKNSK